ncbi:hypothetical protein C8R44DRAFT_821695, partial [Mycena epipterygia]
MASPIDLVQLEILRLRVYCLKVYEPILVVGEDEYIALDIRGWANGGGPTFQVALLIADTRRMGPKKFGRRSARARKQK